MTSLSQEEENYVRMALLLTGVAPRAVRCKFDIEFAPAVLPSAIRKAYHALSGLKGKRVINQAQWNVLHPKKGVTDSKDFDITLMICLLRNLTLISLPSLGYDRLPPPGEISDGADLARIKYYRNYLAHLDDTKIDNSFFISSWTDVADAVGRLGGQLMVQECQKLKVKILDQSNKEIMLEIKQSQKEMKELKDQQEDMRKEVKTQEASHRALHTSYDSLKSDHEEQTREIEALAKSYVSLKTDHDEKTKEVENLAKSYVSLKTDHDEKTKEVEHLAKSYVSLKTDHDEKTKEVENLTKSYASLRTDNETLTKSYSSLKTDQDEKTKEVENLAKSYVSLKTDHDKKTNEVENLAKSYVSLKTDHDEKTKEVENLAKAYVSLRTDNENLAKSYSGLKTDHDEKTKAVETLVKSYVSLKTDHDDKRKEIDKLKAAQEDPVHWNIRGQINRKLETWRKDDKMFMETRAAKYVLECVKTKSCVAVTGSSGMGKTFTVRHAALKMAKDGYDILPVTNPDDIEKFYNPNKKALFVIDNFCGTYTLNQNVLDKWKSLSDTIKDILEDKKTKIIVSCRSQVYQDDLFKTLPLFTSCECNLISKDLCLLPTERKSLAELYLKTDASKISQYVNLYDCFPLLCKLYKENPNFGVIEFFQNPFSVYKSEVSKLWTEGAHGKFCALALCVMFNNRLKEEWLTDDIDNDIRTVIENTCEACKLQRGISRLVIRDELESLTNTFIRKDTEIRGKTCKSTYKKTKWNSISLNNVDEQVFITSDTEDNFSSISDKEDEDVLSFSDTEDEDVLSFSDTEDEGVLSFSDTEDEDLLSILYSDRDDSPYLVRRNRYTSSYSDTEAEYFLSISDTEDDASYEEQNQHNFYSTNHDKLFDYLVSYFGEVMIQCFIKNADSRFIAERFVFQQQDGSDQFSITVPETYQQTYLQRMVDDWSRGHVSDVFNNINMKIQKFRDIFQKYLNKLEPLFQNKLVEMCNMSYNTTDKSYQRERWEKYSSTTPLIHCCLVGDINMVQWFCNHGSNVNHYNSKVESPLYMACLKGHTGIVTKLLDNKADVNQCKNRGQSPLYIACKLGWSEVVTTLLDNKADVNQCIVWVESPLYRACEAGYTEIVTKLLDNKADVNQCTGQGKSPLYIACKAGYTEIVTKLLDNKADVNRCTWGVSPLHIACEAGYTKIVTKLLDNKADINQCIGQGKSPLYIASERGYTEIVTVLLKNKADVNRCSTEGVSPLYKACRGGYAAIVTKLLDNKADVNQCTRSGGSPLLRACEGGYTEIVTKLLDKKADVNQCEFFGESPMYIACARRYTEVVNKLLDRQGDANQCTDEGISPLYIACEAGYTAIVTKLLDKKADVNRCTWGVSPLHIACKAGYTEIITNLLDNKANVNQCTGQGESPLYIACNAGYTEVVTILLNNKADVDECTWLGQSPLYIACNKGYTEVVTKLLNNKADVDQCSEWGKSPLYVACQVWGKLLVRNRPYKILRSNVLHLKESSKDKDRYRNIVKLLMNAGADYTQCTYDGKSPLDLFQHQDVIDMILSWKHRPHVT